ncbi:unnamed protein product [Symbiodinium sp. CCMP2592]|nr:unnamed protein product [Symbiodinium sp. CCMP2592]
MSAAVIGQLLSACAGAYSAASSAVWWAASLPPTCRESMAHAALTCSGATPRYFTPGFGPLALGWGWLVVGVLIGLLSRRAVSAVVALAGGRPSPHTPSNWEALMCELAARTQDPHRHEVLQYILQGGDTALDELSQASGRTSAPLLAHLLADDAVADGAAGGTSVHKADASPLPWQAPDALTGAMAPDAAGEATPGFTPPSTPPVTDEGGACTGYDARQVVPPTSGVAPLPWQDARPPSSAPGERNSWLYIPWLHAGAGNLSASAWHAWRTPPVLGSRFEELAAKLQRAASRYGSGAGPVARCAHALLESYAGAAAAAAARALADDVRAAPIAADQARRSPPLRRGRRRARRRNALSDNSAPPPSEEGEGGVPVCPANAEAPDTMHASASVPETAWATVDAVDLVAELRCPVPTLQDVPPFMRPAIRTALVTALSRIRTASRFQLPQIGRAECGCRDPR